MDGAGAVPAGADRAPRLRVHHPRRRHREVPVRVPAREVTIHHPDITRGSRGVRVWQVRALLQRTRGQRGDILLHAPLQPAAVLGAQRGAAHRVRPQHPQSGAQQVTLDSMSVYSHTSLDTRY